MTWKSEITECKKRNSWKPHSESTQWRIVSWNSIDRKFFFPFTCIDLQILWLSLDGLTGFHFFPSIDLLRCRLSLQDGKVAHGRQNHPSVSHGVLVVSCPPPGGPQSCDRHPSATISLRRTSSSTHHRPTPKTAVYSEYL